MSANLTNTKKITPSRISAVYGNPKTAKAFVEGGAVKKTLIEMLKHH